MLTGIVVVVGGVIGVVLGLVHTSSGPSRRMATRLTPEAAIREAMRGREGRMVQAEFRRRGVIGPSAALPRAFGWNLPL